LRFDKIIQNRTYATVQGEASIDRHGADVVTVVAKLSLSFDKTGKLGLAARPLRTHDEPDGSGGIRYPADFATEKTGTDVGLVGTLVPPDRGGLTQAHAWLRIGSLGKAVQVFGPRIFVEGRQGIVPGPAGPLERTPLIPALAQGGVDDAVELPEQRTRDGHNPSGRGHAADPSRLLGRPAPQIEPIPLLDVVTSINVKTDPVSRAQAAFAPIPPQFQPRLGRRGTEDSAWRRTRAPVAPEDFDPMYDSWASFGLHTERPLTGTEGVELGGLRPGSPIQFHLPGFAPSFRSVERGSEHEHPTHLDGVLFDIDDAVVELTWRVSIPLPMPWARLQRVEVLQAKSLPAEIAQRPQMRGVL